MTQKTEHPGTKSLVIVESPAKARTIGKYLGNNFAVEASIGHIRDLPKGTKDLPEKYKKEKWARLGVDVDHGFEPIYIVPDDKTKQIKKLKALLKEVDSLYLATDEDREGEAISWHLADVLRPKVPVYRLVFHEITKDAILDALEHPRQIDEDLVRAQETRRIIDRLFGYEVSPLLWYKVRNNLSAGRVQSVAVRLIVERERERIRFREATYWDVLGNFVPVAGRDFDATLVSVAGKLIPSGKDFDPTTGVLAKPEKFLLLDGDQTQALIARLSGQNAQVEKVEEKPYTTRPYAPFTTSTLQQEANRKLGFTARKTMTVAQSLYENGYITYMRTDSTTLSQEAIRAARSLVASHYGPEYLPQQPRYYQTKVKNAQEAHEAIRPAGSSFPIPEQLRNSLSSDEFRLYDLIWKRTVASQMTDSHGRRKSITVVLDDARFSASGKTIDFAGYLRAYVEGMDDPEAELADHEFSLPDVHEGETLACSRMTPQSHTTMPPARYSEAALTRTLEEKGIGRPSTYASIIDTILNRNYVFKKNGALVPTWTAFAVCRLLEIHFPDLVDYQFTAEMENQLDAISRGETEHLDYLKKFYFGDDGKTASDSSGSPAGLKQLIENKVGEIDARNVSQILIGTPNGPDGQPGEPIYVRVGRYGPFLQQGERQTGVPDDLPPDELTVAKALELLDTTEKIEEPLGLCPDTGKPIFVKNGRFGPYIQRGDGSDGEKPQNASLVRGMQPADVDLPTALALLSLPRTLGEHPETHEPIVASNGRFGPFIKSGTETRSLSAEMSPLTITLQQAIDLLAQPKYGRARTAAKKSEPIRTFDTSPVTGSPVLLMSGRFGPYVTDGKTNASIPKDISQDDLTFETALDLLAQRAAKGPVTRRKKAAKKAPKKGVKKTTTKSAAKTATKKAGTKKAVVKKASAKKTATAKAASKASTVTKKTAKKTTKKAVKSLDAPAPDAASGTTSSQD
ncbi:MAG: type I DNA topoisomerase [Thermoguttaceae bacterium]|nr:type I DNA topoisomerase [Thermoguttaceae bacterium]